MKKLFSVLIVCFFFGCVTQTFSDDESGLLESINFDIQLILKVKRILKTGFSRYQTSDPGFLVEEGGMKKSSLADQDGIIFKVPEKSQYKLYQKIDNVLSDTGYIPFITDISVEKGFSSIVIIKSNNQFDILGYEKPDGINYDITDIDLKNKLMEWNKKLNIRIIGADYDWVEFTFSKLPDDITLFANEVYEFCPDSVDQGVGTLDALEEQISSRYLFLWWD